MAALLVWRYRQISGECSPFSLSCEPRTYNQKGSSSFLSVRARPRLGPAPGGVSGSLISCGMAPESKAVAPVALVRVAEEGTFPVETKGVCVRVGERECVFRESSERRFREGPLWSGEYKYVQHKL